MPQQSSNKRTILFRYLIGFLVGSIALPMPMGLIVESYYPAHGAGFMAGAITGLILGGPLGLGFVFVFRRLLQRHMRKHENYFDESP